MLKKAYSFELIPLPSVVDFETLVSDFDCDNEKLNVFLREECPNYERERRLNTFLLIDKDSGKLAGFYSTSIGILTLETKDSNDMPEVEEHNYLNLAYFAVDYRYQRRGVGTSLIKEIFRATQVVAYYAGVEMLCLESLDESVDFYKSVGLQLIGVSPEEYQENNVDTSDMRFKMFIRVDDLYQKGYFPYENNFIANDIEVNE